MRQLGDFTIHRKIGEGGMATVYEAVDGRNGLRVALKLLHPELAKSDDGRRRFLQEMRVLADLVHPNIVRSLGNAEIDGELVLVLEYLDGKTLRQVLETEEAGMSLRRAVDIARGVAAALVWAHARNPAVVHRDLKPENLMVMGDGVVKVMDFGIAKVLDDLQGRTSTTQTVGTAQYMSPEQADAKRIGPAADLYGLGLVLYEMVAGRPPFRSESLRELLTLQCTVPPPPLPDDVRTAMPALEPLVMHLLEKAPEARPPSAAHVLAELEKLAQGAPTSPLRRIATATSEARSGGQAHHGSLDGSAKRLDTVQLIDGHGGGLRKVAYGALVFVALAGLVAGGAIWWMQSPTARDEKSDPKESAAGPSASAASPNARTVGDGHVQWDVPADFREFKNDDLLTVKAFRVPHTSGDTTDGELVIRAPGRDLEELVATQRKTFSKCKDADCDLRTKRNVDGVEVTVVELRGVYFPIGEKSSYPNWAMYLAILQVGKAYYSFRCTGPERTIQARKAELDALVDSLHVL